MYNVEMFEEVFANVMDEVGVINWWELYDSDDFDLFEKRLAEKFGDDVLDSDVYSEWVEEMYWEL